MTPVFAYVLGAASAYRAVEARLIDRGSMVELDILHRMSADEIDLVCMRERGMA